MAVTGDLRFLSHHDTMRAIKRTAARAQLPLRYSRGFNPRPAMSLVCPRPVGVATQADLLVMTLDSPIAADDLLRRMNDRAPAGMHLLRAELLTSTKAPRPGQTLYELPLAGRQTETVRQRLEQLAGAESWPVERVGSPKQARKAMKTRYIDLKPLVAEIKLARSILRMTLKAKGDLWARPGEVLRLLGLDERADLAATVRTAIELES